MGWRGTEATVTGTATTLTSLLSLGAGVFARELSVLALSTNTGNVALGASNVTTSANRRVLLEPGKSYTFGPFDSPLVNTDHVFAIGPGTSEKIFVSIVS